MSEKNLCREVSKLLQTMPKGGCEKTLRIVSDHLSKCGECKRLLADLQEMDELLLESKAWFNEAARQTCISRSRIITQMAPLAKRRAWRLRAVWAGAAAILLTIAGAAVLFLFDKGGHAPPIARPPVTRAPAVTQTTAAEHASRTLLRVAAVLRRREAPSPGLPRAPGSVGRASFFPRLLQESTLGSDETLGRILMSRINLTRRNHL